MIDVSQLDTRISVWGILRSDPGYIYVLEHSGRYKIGRSKRPEQRIREAQTWLPDLKVIGSKPFWNVSYVERCLHVGFSRDWYSREWFEFADEADRDFFLEGFEEFSDDHVDRNSIDFIYWMNGGGMAEFVMELEKQQLSVKAFQRQETSFKNKP